MYLTLTYGEACLLYGYVSGCDGRNEQGDSGHGGGSTLGKEPRNPTWDLSILPRFGKHFYDELSTTSQRTNVS